MFRFGDTIFIGVTPVLCTSWVEVTKLVSSPTLASEKDKSSQNKFCFKMIPSTHKLSSFFY